MTVIKERIAEVDGGTCYVAITWDSPLYTDTDLPIAQDLTATYLVRAVHYFNSQNTDRFARVAGDLYTIAAGSVPETTINIQPKNRKRLDSVPDFLLY